MQVRGYRSRAATALSRPAQGAGSRRPGGHPGGDRRRRRPGDQPAPVRQAARRPSPDLRQLADGGGALRGPAAPALRGARDSQRVLAPPRQPLPRSPRGDRGGDQGSRAAGQRGLHDDAGAGDRRRRDRERGADRAAALGRQPPPEAGALGASGGSRGAARLHAGRRRSTSAPRRSASCAPQLVQAIAAVQLLVAGWCEPPEAGALHLVDSRAAGPLHDRAARRCPGRSALAGALPRGGVPRGRFGAFRRAPAQPREPRADPAVAHRRDGAGSRPASGWSITTASTRPSRPRRSTG